MIRRPSARTMTGLAVWVALSLGGVFGMTEVVLYSQHSLHHLGSWVATKKILERGLMGGMEVPKTRQAVAGNQLNLGVWHSYNEFIWDRPVTPSKVEFDVFLEKDAYIVFEYNRDARGFSGLRLSLNPRFPSMHFRANQEGMFEERTLMDPSRLRTGWNRIEVEFASGTSRVLMGGRPVFSYSEALKPDRLIGFRNGASSASVDNLRIWDADGRPVLKEGFRNTQGYFRVLLFCALGLGLFSGLAFAAAFLWMKPEVRLFPVIFLNFFVLLLISVYYVYDHRFYSRSYPFNGFLPLGVSYPARSTLVFEEWRNFLFNRRLPLWMGLRPVEPTRPSHQLLQALGVIPSDPRRHMDGWLLTHFNQGYHDGFLCSRPEVDLPAPRGDFRLALIGTSQTFGAGTGDTLKTWAAGLFEKLQRTLPAGRTLDLYNLSICGSNSGDLLDRYKRSWSKISPHLGVINLGANDVNDMQFVANIKEFISLIRAAGGDVVLLKEAKSSDGYAQARIAHRHRLLDGIAHAENRTLHDLNGFLASGPIYDSGFLWWDEVHMTGYAQRRVAEWLAPLLQEKLPKR